MSGSGGVAGTGGGAGGGAGIGGGGAGAGGVGIDGGAGTTGCFPPFPKKGKTLYSNGLESLTSLDQPFPGDGAGTTHTLETGDFGLGICNVGVHFSSSLKQFAFAEATDTHVNIDYREGSLRFWYRPDYEVNDSQTKTLLRTDEITIGGGLQLFRKAANGGHEFHFEHWPHDSSGKKEALALVSAPDLPKDEWTFISVSWKQNVVLRIWVGSAEVTYTVQDSVGSDPPKIVGRKLNLGVNPNKDQSANGWIDQIAIYDRAW